MIFLPADYDSYVNIIGISLATVGSYVPRMGYGDMPGYEWFSISVTTEGHVFLVEVATARNHLPQRLLGHIARTRTIPVIPDRAETHDRVSLWLGTQPGNPTHMVEFAEEEDFDGELDGTVWLFLEGDSLIGLRFDGASRLLPPEVLNTFKSVHGK